MRRIGALGICQSCNHRPRSLPSTRTSHGPEFLYSKKYPNSTFSQDAKEINRDLGVAIPKHGDLTTWAKQGVLLLNSILTVEANRPASHKNFGWEIFTDAAIKNISENKENMSIYALWGNHAQNKKSLIDSKKHLILKSQHLP